MSITSMLRKVCMYCARGEISDLIELGEFTEDTELEIEELLINLSKGKCQAVVTTVTPIIYEIRRLKTETLNSLQIDKI